MKRKPVVLLALFVLCALVLSACSGGASSSSSASQLPPSSSEESSQSVVSSASSSISSSSGANNALLQTVLDEAKLGKVINCEYVINNITIEDIENAWGTADKNEYVASAKGTYYTFNSKHIVVGVNKGDLVFEIRSYAPELSAITYTDVVATLGEPEHTSTTTDGEHVIGYTLTYAGDNQTASNMNPLSEFKIKFVFPSNSGTAVLSHYMVVDPTQTENSMADDSGREW